MDNTTIRTIIEKYGADKEYIFFKVFDTLAGRMFRIIGTFVDDVICDYRKCTQVNNLPLPEIRRLGISAAELKFYRDVAYSEAYSNFRLADVSNEAVDYSIDQCKTNNGKNIKTFLPGTYAMIGEVAEAYYDIFVTRTGYARVKARSANDAFAIADDLTDEDISWSDDWETECGFSADQDD